MNPYIVISTTINLVAEDFTNTSVTRIRSITIEATAIVFFTEFAKALAA